MNILYDLKSLLLSNINTGIQRVERNIFNAIGLLQSKLDFTLYGVVNDIRNNLFVIDVNLPLKSLDDLNYIQFAHIGAMQIYRFKYLVDKLLFDKYNIGSLNPLFGYFVLIVFFIPICLIIISIIAICMIMKNRYMYKFDSNNFGVFVVPGLSWLSPLFMNRIKVLKKHNYKVVLLVHDIFPLTHPRYSPKYLVRLFGRRIKSVFQHLDLIIAVSDFTKTELKKYIQTNEIKCKCSIESISLGADLDLMLHSKSCRPLVHDLFSSQYVKYICVGTLHPRKNHHFLLDAFEIIWEKYPDVQLIIIGRREVGARKLIKRIKKHSEHGKSLIWLNDLSDSELACCYQNAKALIFPSIIEGYGLPIVEALRFGCPVIASDIPIFHEVGGDSCLYFSLDAPESLAQLIMDIESRKTLLKNPKTQDHIWPTWEECAEKLLLILHRNFVGSDLNL